MVEKIEISIDVIVHATEDISKIFQAFDNVLGLNEEIFEEHNTFGHFDNPITMLSTKIVKKEARSFIKKFLGLLSNEQINELIEDIEERTEDSRFHMRLDKQEFVKGNLVFQEKDTIKIKIHTPIYNKKDTAKIFSEIFQISN